eukprot:TRINITY_DN865_c1_g1_i3.p1 TRINITY_DN865_c1_g1~~TRINITY_DN865_c1_g1_i3.p1  ORF type:complete len:371 (+),score=141.33 TRINITY_DN865_c1_g1_i3:1755-2867(+)
MFRFIGNEDVKGTVNLMLTPKTKKVDHVGIKIEFVGQIELFYDRGNHFEFTSLVSELAMPGSLTTSTAYQFEFTKPEKLHESYNGVNCRCRYFLRATVMRNFLANIVKEMDLWVINYQAAPETNSCIKMEVGIEDCLHIEFEYNKSKYHLKDVVVGKVFFLLVRIKIKHMELLLLKRESTGQPPNVYNETETLTKYEIMDGAPVKGESLPVRLFLGHFDVTPTYRNANNKFSVKYYLNLVLVDEEDRRYFKQHEITLWRRRPKGTKAGPKFLDQALAERTTPLTLTQIAAQQQQRAKEKEAKAAATETPPAPKPVEKKPEVNTPEEEVEQKTEQKEEEQKEEEEQQVEEEVKPEEKPEEDKKEEPEALFT